MKERSEAGGRAMAGEAYRTPATPWVLAAERSSRARQEVAWAPSVRGLAEGPWWLASWGLAAAAMVVLATRGMSSAGELGGLASALSMLAFRAMGGGNEGPVTRLQCRLSEGGITLDTESGERAWWAWGSVEGAVLTRTALVIRVRHSEPIVVRGHDAEARREAQAYIVARASAPPGARRRGLAALLLVQALIALAALARLG